MKVTKEITPFEYDDHHSGYDRCGKSMQYESSFGELYTERDRVMSIYTRDDQKGAGLGSSFILRSAQLTTLDRYSIKWDSREWMIEILGNNTWAHEIEFHFNDEKYSSVAEWLKSVGYKSSDELWGRK